MLVAQSCPTLRPHGLQLTRLLCPWDFPGKDIGVDCHFLLQGIFLTQGSNPGLLHWRQMLYPLSHEGTVTWGPSQISISRSVVSDSLRPHGLQPTRLLCPWDFPGKDIGVGCHFLLQGIFPTQGSKPGPLHCRQILYQLSYKGSPLFAIVRIKTNFFSCSHI